MFRNLLHTKFLLGLVFLLFPIAHWKISVLDFPLYLSEIPLLVALGIILWNIPKEKWNWKEIFFQNKILFVGITLFLLGAALSYGLNPHTMTGLGMLKSFFFLPVLLALLLSLTIKNRFEGEKILWLWLAGLTTTAWISLIFPIMTYDHRLVSLYESPNYLAMLLSPGVLLSLYFFLTSPRSLLRLGNIFFGCIVVVALLLTHSYGAVFSLLLSFSCFIALNRLARSFPLKKYTFVICLLLAALFSILWSTEKFQALLNGDPRSSLASREMIWAAALKIGGDNFVLGIGPGNFQREYLLYQKYFPPYLEWAVPQPHNLYLAFWLQAGLLGITGFIAIIFSVAKSFLKRLKQNNLSTEERLLGTLLISLLLFYLVYGLIDTPYFKNDLAFAFWGVLGLLVAWSKRPSTA